MRPGEGRLIEDDDGVGLQPAKRLAAIGDLKPVVLRIEQAQFRAIACREGAL